ncbi:MAG: hypothetical protein ACI35O_14045, partial [Bacillaceae bacterium]
MCDENLNKISNNIRNQVFIPLLTALVSFVVIESTYRGGMTSFLTWVKYYPTNSMYFFVFLFLLFASFMLLNYKGYFIASVLSSFLFCILAFSSHLKEVLRGDPLLPTDLTLINEA